MRNVNCRRSEEPSVTSEFTVSASISSNVLWLVKHVSGLQFVCLCVLVPFGNEDKLFYFHLVKTHLPVQLHKFLWSLLENNILK